MRETDKMTDIGNAPRISYQIKHKLQHTLLYLHNNWHSRVVVN